MPPKKLLAVVLLLATALFLGVLPGIIGPWLISRAILEAAKQGVQLQVKDSSFEYPLRLRASGVMVTARLGGVPVPFVFDNADITVSPLSLISGGPSSTAILSGYGGKVELLSHHRLFGNRGNMEFRGTLVLERHPFIALAGVRGNVAFQGQGSYGPEGFSADVELNGTKGFFAGKLPFTSLLKLSPISFDSIQVRGRVTQGDIRLDSAKVDSSAGTAEGSGALTCDLLAPAPQGVRCSKGQIRFVINLSDSGANEIGPYVALAAGTDPQQKVKTFETILAPQNGLVRATVKPIAVK